MRTSDAAPTVPGRPFGRAGFSLMEVVVALGIILILLPVALPVFESFTADIEEQNLRSRLQEFRRALLLFYEDHRRYPYMIEDHFGNRVNILDNDESELVAGVHSGLGTYPPNPRRYLASVPIDPFSKRADWKLNTVAPRNLLPTSHHPMPTTSSTRQVSAAFRGVTSGAVRVLDNVTPVERLQVIDIRSRSPGYEDL